MTENDNNIIGMTASGDDLLLEQFFRRSRAEQISDDGFSRRVMMSLPAAETATASALRLSRLWTAACLVVAIAVFTLVGGWQMAVRGILSSLTSPHTSAQLLQLMVCGAALTTLAATELMRRERFLLHF